MTKNVFMTAVALMLIYVVVETLFFSRKCAVLDENEIIKITRDRVLDLNRDNNIEGVGSIYHINYVKRDADALKESTNVVVVFESGMRTTLVIFDDCDSKWFLKDLGKSI